MPLLMTEMVVFALNLTHPRLADKTFGLPAIWQTTTLILLFKMSMITGKVMILTMKQLFGLAMTAMERMVLHIIS